MGISPVFYHILGSWKRKINWSTRENIRNVRFPCPRKDYVRKVYTTCSASKLQWINSEIL